MSVAIQARIAGRTVLAKRFDKHAAQFAQSVAIDLHQIIRPFQPHRVRAQRPQRFRCRDAGDQTQAAEAGERAVETARDRQIQLERG